MAKFKIGDRAKCINASSLNGGNPPPLVLGREYIVYGIDICPKCQLVALDIGLVSQTKLGSHCPCGINTLPSLIWWAAASRFEKAIEKVEYIAVATDIEIQEPVLN